MTVLLVILMFATFVALDHMVGARREARRAARRARAEDCARHVAAEDLKRLVDEFLLT